MIVRINILILIALLIAPTWAADTLPPSEAPRSEAPQSEIPPGGEPIIADDAFIRPDTMFFGAKYGNRQVVTLDDAPFQTAVRITTETQPVKFYHIGVKVTDLQPINRGDALLLSFYARTTAGGDPDNSAGQIDVSVNVGAESVAKWRVTPGEEWTQYFLAAPARLTSEAGKSFISLNAGAITQTVEIGQVRFLNYRNRVAIEDLPVTRFTYDGRELDAPWRQAAHQRIDKIRKADLTVAVNDAAGNAVADATVEVKMKKHAFLWGASLNRNANYDNLSGENHRTHHKRLFNMGVCEGEFVWTEWTDPKVREEARQLMQYFKDNGQYIRVHVLVWERRNVLPPELHDALDAGDKGRVRKIVTDHIRQVMTEFSGVVDEWVVENEAVDNNQIRRVLGKESIAEWFKIARELDPTARLVFNENHLEGGKPDKLDRFLDLATTITNNGGPLDVLGIQGHVGSTPLPPETLLARYDILAATGHQLAITEFDMASDDEQLKADYTRDVMTAVFSHPGFYNFTIWKWYSKSPQRLHPVIYNSDWTLKPAGKVYEDLVFNKWWTNEKGVTDSSGKFSTRGFLGDYEITVTAAGKTQTLPVTLSKDQTVTATLR